MTGWPAPGQTSNSIYYSNAQPSNAGLYCVTVQNAYAGTNLFGGPTSSIATVHVGRAWATFTRITNGPVVTDSARAYNGMWGDYDGDGWLDLVVEGDYWSSGRNTQFYHNEGSNGLFTRLTNSLMTNATDQVSCSPWVDLDNDGDLDIFMGTYEGQAPFVYRNHGGGVFTREAAPLNLPVRGRTLSWGDYDGDGFLDAFLGIYSGAYPGGRNSLLHNNKDGTFTVVTNQPMCLDITDEATSSWIDYDNDGDLDLLAVRSQAAPTRLYRNDGNGQFAMVTLLPNAISGAWADFDNDGDLDLVIGSRFEVNQGNGTFLPWTGQPATLTSVILDAPIWGDYDNDGCLDLYCHYAGQPCRLYRNRAMAISSRSGTGRQSETSAPSSRQHGQTTTTMGGWTYSWPRAPPRAAWPQSPLPEQRNSNHWLKIRFKGTASNSHAVGARVYARPQSRASGCVRCGTITAESVIQELEAHFGLGDATKAETVRVEWPSSRVTEWYNVAAEQILTLTEPTNDLPVITAPFGTQTNAIGTTATFSVVATGTPPLSYQWRSYSSGDGVHQHAGRNQHHPGADQCADHAAIRGGSVEHFWGSYQSGCSESGLPGRDHSAPVNPTVELGTPFSLSVVATGAAPLYYQWYHDGVAVPGQTSNSI